MVAVLFRVQMHGVWILSVFSGCVFFYSFFFFYVCVFLYSLRVYHFTVSSFVIYGSVNGEAELSTATFHENFYQLDGLDKDAAYQLAREIIEKDAEKDIGDLNEQNTFDFNQLLQQLAGFPSAMQTILPKLKTQSVEEVLNDLRSGK